MSTSYTAAKQGSKTRSVWAVAIAVLILPLVAGATDQAQAQNASRRFAPDLTAFCKKYFPNSSPRFSQARQQWVCARNVNGREIHRNIAMDVACSMTEKDARYAGQRGQTPFCLKPGSPSGDAKARSQ